VLGEDTSGDGTTIYVSGEQNIFLSDGESVVFDDIQTELDIASEAPEKLWFSVSNYSKAGNILGLDYPLSVELERDGENVFSQTNV